MEIRIKWHPYKSGIKSGFLLDLFFNPEDGGYMLLQNISLFSTDCTALYPRR
jgi:hypothetical protein